MDAVIPSMAPTPSMLPPHSPQRRVIEGHGTREADWQAAPVLHGLHTVDASAWARRHRRIWILAPHPDDEVLALGGTIRTLADHDADICIVSVTNGEASHGSEEALRVELGRERPRELRRALDCLGVHAGVLQLGLPDGRVTITRKDLLKALVEVVQERDLILATWRFDGHPDHEACGDVAALVGELTGAPVIEYPVWMWHWASPSEETIPWARARRIEFGQETRASKRSAIDAFVSQVTSVDAQEPVLPSHVLERFARPFEIVFV